jgi:hypothetical protein
MKPGFPTSTILSVASSQSLGTSNASQTASSSIWDDALDRHLAKLKPADRKICRQLQTNFTFDQASFEAFFLPLQKKYEGNKFHRLMARAGPIATHILSFGRAMDVAVGQGPLGAGLIWGGMRVLLEV